MLGERNITLYISRLVSFAMPVALRHILAGRALRILGGAMGAVGWPTSGFRDAQRLVYR